MKTKTFFTTALLLILTCTFAFSTVKQERNVGSFTKVSVSSGINLYLTQGNTHSVTVETDEEIVNLIETEVKSGMLAIKVKSGEKINWKKGKLVLNVHVTAPVIEALQGSGGADIYLETPINSNGSLNIALSGGADLKTGSIKAKDINLKLSGGSDAKHLDVTADKLTAYLSGGADCAGTINAPTIYIEQSGGSDSNITVSADTLTVITSGGSDAKLSGKTNTIVAKASGASDIKATNLTYEQSDIRKSGGADIYLK